VLLPVAGVVVYWVSSGYAVLAWDIVSHLFLPVLTLTLYSYGGTMLLMRTTMLETLREDYIMTARAKGLPDTAVRDKHAARNALLPVWTGLVFGIVLSVGGGIITETVFSWPGIGLAYLNAATSEDIPVAMGILTILGVLTLVAQLIVDIGYAFLDPRIRYS
jgi:peptide/nickel transport system permease protein